MKNAIKLIRKSVLVVIVFTTMLGNANEISSFVYKEDLKGNASVTIDNVRRGNLLSIQDDYGTIVYKETINTSGTYTKGFDLTSLPDGNYFFEIDKELEISTIPFTVEASIVLFDKDKEVTIYKPFITQKNGLTLITKLSPNLEPLNIEIYYEANEVSNLVFSEEIKGVQNIERAYKLSNGNYKLIFKFNNKEITKFINN